MKKYLQFFNKILLISVVFFLIFSQEAFSDTLTIHYYSNFNDFAELDSKYSQPDKYLVYKYASLNINGDVNYSSVVLGFNIDQNWYEKNKIKDIVFLRYSDNSWARINYKTKSESSGHIHYQVESDKLGEYWAIIGILPNGTNVVTADILAKNKEELKHIAQENQNIIQRSLDKFKVHKFIQSSKNAINILQEPAKVKGISTVAMTTTSLFVGIMLFFLRGPMNLLIILRQPLLALTGLLYMKKKIKKGIVYDINTGRPIPLVRVDIIDKKNGKIKTTKFTNKKGEYYFLVPKGEYIVEAKKPEYRIIDISEIKFVKALLHKNDIFKEVKLEKYGIIKKNIALLRNDKKIYSKYVFIGILKIAMEYIVKMLFIIGLLASIWMCYVKPNFLNYSMLVIYVLVIIFRLVFINKEKFGVVVNENNEPRAFATISIFRYNNKKIVSRMITDTKGRYYVSLDKGTYLLTIKTNEGIVAEKKIKVLNKGALSQKIVIKNK